MNIVHSDFEIIEQEYNSDDLLTGVYKHIEICGRNCYKSEDKITDDSYKGFVERLMKSKHGAMLEHGTVYLTIHVLSPLEDNEYMKKIDLVNFFKKNKYSRVKEVRRMGTHKINVDNKDIDVKHNIECYYITTNYRVIYESSTDVVEFYDNYKSNSEKLSDYVLKFMTAPSEYHVKRHTVAFTYHLAAARDVNRHRVQSIAEESTRYCNYTKDKFGGSLNIVPPERFTADKAKENLEVWKNREADEFFAMITDIYTGQSFMWSDIDWWLFANIACEKSYFTLKEQFDWSNQECSLVLPLGTKTCSIHTAFDDDWAHFFNLRSLGTTGAPRPSIKKLATALMEIFLTRHYIDKSQLDREHYQKFIEKKNE